MVVRIACILIGFIVLYKDVSAIRRPENMSTTLRVIAPPVHQNKEPV